MFSTNLITIPTAEDLGNREWLSFWASYMGGALGIAATLIAFSFTAKQNSLQHNQTQTEIKEQERLRIMPCADTICSKATALSEHCIVLTPGGHHRYYYLPNEPENIRYNCNQMLPQDSLYVVNVTIRNLGGVMRSITIYNAAMEESAQLTGIITGESLELSIVHMIEEMNPCEFRIEFDDIQGRRYFQTFSYSLHFFKFGNRVEEYDKHVTKVLKHDFISFPKPTT